MKNETMSGAKNYKGKLKKFIDFVWKFKYLIALGIFIILIVLKQVGIENISKNIGEKFHIAGTVALAVGCLIFLKKKGGKGLSDLFGDFKFFRRGKNDE